MVYNTQNYWVFGLFPSSGILETRKQDVSETGYVSVLRCVNLTGVVQWLRLALSSGPTCVGVFPPTPEDGKKSSFRNVVFLEFLEYRMTEKVQKPSNSECLGKVYTGFVWLRIRASGRLLWMRCWTCGFHEMLGKGPSPCSSMVSEAGRNECSSSDTVLSHLTCAFLGARGGVVVEALRYKPEGRGIASRWGGFFF
jgi:hypothetical protein